MRNALMVLVLLAQVCLAAAPPPQSTPTAQPVTVTTDEPGVTFIADEHGRIVAAEHGGITMPVVIGADGKLESAAVNNVEMLEHEAVAVVIGTHGEVWLVDSKGGVPNAAKRAD